MLQGELRSSAIAFCGTRDISKFLGSGRAGHGLFLLLHVARSLYSFQLAWVFVFIAARPRSCRHQRIDIKYIKHNTCIIGL